MVTLKKELFSLEEIAGTRIWIATAQDAMLGDTSLYSLRLYHLNNQADALSARELKGFLKANQNPKLGFVEAKELLSDLRTLKKWETTRQELLSRGVALLGCLGRESNKSEAFIVSERQRITRGAYE